MRHSIPIAIAALLAGVGAASAAAGQAVQPPAAAPTESASASPLVVHGRRIHHPTWRGPQGRPLKAPPESWGKAGVSLADYRSEAAECTRRAYYLDISKTKEVDALSRASRRIDSLNTQANMSADPAQSYAEIARERQGVNYEAKQETLEEMMQATVDHCLTEHGYHKFRLTRDQRDQLGKLAFGSDARRSFLYSLASDPKVLADQGEGSPGPAADTPPQ